MSRLSKGLLVSVLGAVIAVGAAPAYGQTVAELQAQISALLAQIQALQSQLTQTTGGGTAVYSWTRDLTLGSTGDDVKALQQFLNGQGFTVSSSGAGAPGSESTYFGAKTKAALAKFQAAKGISPAAGYFGPITRSYVATNYGTGTGGTGVVTPPPSGAFVFMLASDNPIGSALPKGAAGVVLMKFVVSGTGTLGSVTFKREGIGATGDFASSGFYLYDGATRLTSGRSINSTTHEISFLNLALAVSGSKTLTLVADISSSATTGNRHMFKLVSGTGTPTPTGTLVGSEFSIAGQQVGGVTATSSASLSNPKVGQIGAKIAEFRLTASSTEDIQIKMIALTEGGSIANANLANFVLKQAGNTVATAAAIGAKDLVSFVFATPFNLDKGQQRTFEVYADIGGSTRSSDTIVLYFDSKSDIQAIGKTYGFNVDPDIVGLDSTGEGQTLTVQGGEITITFNGPVSKDIALRGQDVELFNFTLASQNNIEIRNVRFNATTTTGTTAVYNDVKLWDTSSNAVVTSAVTVPSGAGNFTYTDVINVSAGQSKTYKVTADVDSTTSVNGTIRVSLLAFQSSDVKNLDNNTYVATTVIVPNSTVSGNILTVKSPSLDVQLSSSPTSQTQVRGTNGIAIAGFSFRAVAGQVRLDSVRITATSTSGTLTSDELQSLALYDGATRISDFKSLDVTALNATFNNLNLTIAEGVTKVLTLKGNVAATATNGDVVYAYIASITTSDISVYDVDGNAASVTGTPANTGGTVRVTLSDTGDVTVVKAADDTESEAGIVIAGTESVLGKFRFTSSNEAMTVNKLQLLIVPTSGAIATSPASADEVPTVKLYDGATQIGSSYAVTYSGDNSGTVYIESLGWVIAKDVSKTLTVKGVLNTIAGGADTGASVYAHVIPTGFEAQGASAKDTTVTEAIGNEKVVYKTKPTLTVTNPGSTLVNGSVAVLRFTVSADAAEQVTWKKVQVKVVMTGATMSAVDTTAPGTSGNPTLRDVSSGTYLNIATAFSGSAVTASTTRAAIQGGNTGYVTLILNSEEVVSAGGSKTYELALTFVNVPTGTESASAVLNLHRTETAKVAATTFDNAELSDALGVYNGSPSFIWSDSSVVGHSESTADWANSVYIKTLPSVTVTTSK